VSATLRDRAYVGRGSWDPGIGDPRAGILSHGSVEHATDVKRRR
jgi:hypothetical protein